MKRSGIKRKPPKKGHGFNDEVRQQARVRAGFRCEARTAVCVDSIDEFHHRKLRSQGGPHTLVNCLPCCLPCHDHIHAKDGKGSITKSKLMGWIVASFDDPAEVPIKSGSGGR